MTYYPSSAKYEREKLLRVMVKFHREHEAELVERMEQQENRAGYLKELVRRDIEAGKENKEGER